MTLRNLALPTMFVLALVGAACNGDEDVDVGVGEDTTTSRAGATTTTQGDGAAQSFTADLAALNDSGASGTATVEVNGSQLTVEVQAEGVSSGVPHAQHIHIGGRNECPDESLQGDDEFLTTAEGQPAYGGVKVSLTTSGDVSDKSALAVERFPTAQNESYTYERTFDLPPGLSASDVADGVIVVHGITDLFGDDAAFDGQMKSSLDESLPLEATIPAACGKLTAS